MVFKSVNGHKAFQHSGSWQGYNSYIARFPDDKLTVIVLTNLNPSNPGLIAKDIAALYIPELSRQKIQIVKDDNAVMTKFVTQVFKNPYDTNLDNELISKEYKPKMQALLTTNNSLLNTFGPLQNAEPLNNVNSNQSRYLIKYKVGSRIAIVNKNKTGQITNIISEAY